ncbi:MAG: HesA/MoeB/ThiF family protein [Desulfobacteraceae bacterium]|nr:MAG: HesA/MoeB/ThiF family protein [Desulfobacteraceae bacterium]
MEIADQLGCGLSAVYRESLGSGVCPYRYLRNRDAVSMSEQLKLAFSRVAVIGAGGLGGHVIHLLARIGVGQLVVVDCDVFDETNLNRQILCTSDSLGKPKALVAAQFVAAVNPGVEVISHVTRIGEDNLPRILAGVEVVVDGLDNIQDRLILERSARVLKIPLVHGAIAGFDGQLMTIFPEDRGLLSIYGPGEKARKNPKSPEAVMGVPALMPSMIATLEAMEVMKILLGRGSLLRNTLLHVGLDACELNRFALSREE